MAQGFDFRRKIVDGCRAAAGVLGIGFVHFFQVTFEAFVNFLQPVLEIRPREVALAAVDRLDAGAVDSKEFASVQVEFAAQLYKAPEHLPERPAVVTPEVCDGLEVGLEATQQPNHLEVSVSLQLQASAGTDAIEVVVEVEFQEVARIVPWPSRAFGVDAPETGSLQIQAVNKCINETDRIVRSHVVVHSIGQKQKLGPVFTSDVCHGLSYQPLWGT